MRLQLSYFSEEKKGDLLSRFTTDVREIELALLASVNAAFKEPFYILGYIITLFVINIKLSIFIIVFLPVSGTIISLVGRGLRKRARDGQQQVGELLSSAEESLSGLKIIRGFNAEEKVQQKFEDKSNLLRKLMIRVFRRVDIASPASEFLGIVATSGVLLYGGHLVFSDQLEPDLFIGYLVLFSQLINPFKSISKAIYEANRGNAALNRIEEITKAEVSIKDKENAIAISDFSDSVHYKNVCFKYEHEYVLKQVDLEIKKGQTIALVGQSGSGKSTLADLLPRFHDIQEGEILIDGVNIKNVTLKSLRDQLGIVTQQSILFNDTVFNNIAFGVPNATKEQVIEAAKIANAHEFIEQLDKGYETNIGDGGGKLSGGQRQRLSIARAVLKNPPLLILDEATSALDTESEKLVQDALNKLMENRTSLVIAHRLSTIQHADRIIVMHEGKIVEEGNHQELIAAGGVYKRLTELQSFS
jgi:ABC-type multidrug transport system fused ATPase/permease subunit